MGGLDELSRHTASLGATGLRILVTVTLATGSGGCGSLGWLVGASIDVRGAHRTLEDQILGAFEHIGQEVYLLAGVRSVDPMTGVPQAPRPMSAAEAAAIRARQRMEYNRDDLVQFERDGFLGEANDASVAVLAEGTAALREQNPRLHDLVRALAAEENEDRLVVMRRIAATNPDLHGEDGLGTVRRVLASRYREAAPAGAAVQLRDGTWSVKAEAGP
jgi:hypothetical protein